MRTKGSSPATTARLFEGVWVRPPFTQLQTARVAPTGKAAQTRSTIQKSRTKPRPTLQSPRLSPTAPVEHCVQLRRLMRHLANGLAPSASTHCSAASQGLAP
jgi:hypothetical protein